MSDQVSYDDIEVGAELDAVSYPVTRLSLVQYCGASGDFNVIHWNERIAKSVGLPDVIAHGMFTMAQAGRYVTDWAGPKATVARIRRQVLSASGGPRRRPWRDDLRSARRSRRSSTTTASRWP